MPVTQVKSPNSKQREDRNPGKLFGKILKFTIVLILPLYLGCLFSGDKKKERFIQLGDTDKFIKYDKTIIVVYDTSDTLIDTLFSGKVYSSKDLSRLSSPNLNITVVFHILGFEGEILKFHQVFAYNPSEKKVFNNRYPLKPASNPPNEFLQVGKDTTIGINTEVEFHPIVSELPSNLTAFYWDVDGDGIWDDSSTIIKNVSANYTIEKTLSVRFGIRTKDGKEYSASKKVKVVSGPVIQFIFPRNGDTLNQNQIEVKWMVDGEIQLKNTFSDLNTEGPNLITREYTDSSGTYSESITVFLDTTPPAPPIFTGDTISNTTTPIWIWKSGGGGHGKFRIDLDEPIRSTSPVIADTMYLSPRDLTLGLHTLFIQERDSAGNWSQVTKFPIKIVSGPPNKTIVNAPHSPTNLKRPVWTWQSGGNGGTGTYILELKFQDEVIRKDTLADSAFSPDHDLSEGIYEFSITEFDLSNSTSPTASSSVLVDLTPPNAALFTETAFAPDEPILKWSWKSGGGGNEEYRISLNDTDFSQNSKIITSTEYIPTDEIGKASYTLYVQERDEAGNWSKPAGKLKQLKWQQFGQKQSFNYTVSASISKDIHLSITKKGNPIIGFKNENADLKATVLNLNMNNNLWEELGGNGITDSLIFWFSLALDANDNPAIAFTDFTNEDKLSVMKYSPENLSWDYIGKKGFTDSIINSISLSFNEQNIPHVFFRDGAVDFSTSIMRFADGWKYLGNKGFVKQASARNTLAFNSIGTPIVSFEGTDSKVRVYQFNESQSNWIPLGNNPLTDTRSSGSSMVINQNDAVLIAIRDENFDCTVFKLDRGENNWEILEKKAFAGSSIISPSLAINQNNTPFVAFLDQTNNYKISIMLYNKASSQWEYFGPETIFPGPASSLAFDISPKGIPYIAFREDDNGGKLSVWYAFYQ